jgi:phosphoglycolate phosphatase-like HAD superfamily hydrolase
MEVQRPLAQRPLAIGRSIHKLGANSASHVVGAAIEETMQSIFEPGRRRVLHCAAAGLLLLANGCASMRPDPLPSWNEGAAKQSILAFVAKVSTRGSPSFVPIAERIATFDNDGTLWAEQPLYSQMLFVLDRVKVLAPQHPEWRTTEPFASLLKGDLKGALAGGEEALLQMVAATSTGMSSDEFDAIVTEWLATARHPRFNQPYPAMAYQPMVELLAYLRANGFKTFIVSGGGADFMRPWTEKAYGIPPEQVVGSSGKIKYEIVAGKPMLLRLPDLDFIDDGPGKPIGILRHIGRRPILAFGNSDGDLEMLQWTAGGGGARFMGIIHHTDAEREWAYDRQSSVGKLDKALDQAQASGWTVVDMKADWNLVFAFQKK